MNKIIVICLLIVSSTLLISANASVTVTVKQDKLIFAKAPRLTEVLALIKNTDIIYWPSATLFEENNSEIEKTRLSVLQKTSSLIEQYASYNVSNTNALTNLQNTLTNWQLAKRLAINIDYDLARIVPSANPLLPQGSYILELNPRQNNVIVFGAIDKTTSLIHKPHGDISEYLTLQSKTDLAEDSFVFIIQSDGRVIRAPIAYWNKTHQEVMPGSHIFVPFKSSIFFSDFVTLNQHVVDLAKNRISQ